MIWKGNELQVQLLVAVSALVKDQNTEPSSVSQQLVLNSPESSIATEASVWSALRVLRKYVVLTVPEATATTILPAARPEPLTIPAVAQLFLNLAIRLPAACGMRSIQKRRAHYQVCQYQVCQNCWADLIALVQALCSSAHNGSFLKTLDSLRRQNAQVHSAAGEPREGFFLYVTIGKNAQLPTGVEPLWMNTIEQTQSIREFVDRVPPDQQKDFLKYLIDTNGNRQQQNPSQEELELALAQFQALKRAEQKP